MLDRETSVSIVIALLEYGHLVQERVPVIIRLWTHSAGTGPARGRRILRPRTCIHSSGVKSQL